MNLARLWSFVDRMSWDVLSTSATATLLVVLVLAVSWVLGRRIQPAWRHALWLVVLLRLLVPAVPVASFHPLAFSNFSILVPAADEPWSLTVRSPDAELAERPTSPAEMNEPKTPAFAALPVESRAGTPELTAFRPIRVVALIWVAGVLIFGAWALAARVRLARLLRACGEVAEPRLLDALAECRRQIGLRRHVAVRVSPGRIGPAVAGIWHPCIVLPADWASVLDDEQLRFVLLHELTHVRRFDPCWRALAMLARVIHWFNPAVWWVATRMQRDCELAADAAVLRSIGQQSGPAYGHTILRLVERFVGPHPAPFGISDSRWLHQRISMITAFRSAKPTAWLVGTALLTLFAAIGLTRAGADPPSEKSTEKRSEQVGLDEETQQRVEKAIQKLRVYNISSEATDPWAHTLRDLIEIGKPAVPLLVVELDRTDRNQTLRALGFALRGIDDPRAIPALIRALPRTLVPSLSDYGLNLDGDPKLLKFMQRYDLDEGEDGAMFSYGRPFREVVAALRKLTDVQHWEMEVNFVNLSGSARHQRMQRELYRKLTKTWADWWTNNWQRYLQDPADAELDLTRAAVGPPVEVGPPPKVFPIGPNVEMASGMNFPRLLPSYAESPEWSCLDLDTGRFPRPPADLIDKAGAEPSKQLLEWAEREGVDLIGVNRKLPDLETVSRWPVSVGLRLRGIGDRGVVEDLKQGRPLDIPTELASQIPYQQGEYAFITREGTCGVLRLNPNADSGKPRVVGTPAPRGNDIPMGYSLIYTKASTGGDDETK